VPRSIEPKLSAPAAQTLYGLADRLVAADDPWWLIGGAAVALHGVGTGDLVDIDVVMSRNDAARLLHALGAAPERGGGAAQFRSAVFGHWRGAALPVDIMGDFEACSAGVWRRIQPQTRDHFDIAGRSLYAPARAELIELLRMFGRPKDLARADALFALGREGD